MAVHVDRSSANSLSGGMGFSSQGDESTHALIPFGPQLLGESWIRSSFTRDPSGIPSKRIPSPHHKLSSPSRNSQAFPCQYTATTPKIGRHVVGRVPPGVPNSQWGIFQAIASSYTNPIPPKAPCPSGQTNIHHDDNNSKLPYSHSYHITSTTPLIRLNYSPTPPPNQHDQHGQRLPPAEHARAMAQKLHHPPLRLPSRLYRPRMLLGPHHVRRRHLSRHRHGRERIRQENVPIPRHPRHLQRLDRDRAHRVLCALLADVADVRVGERGGPGVVGGPARLGYHGGREGDLFQQRGEYILLGRLDVCAGVFLLDLDAGVCGARLAQGQLGEDGGDGQAKEGVGWGFEGA
ncbi:hypothetical protein V500_06828 [Pseudogymnoascus sp. VKM F-4518 (FW-2643)]|nr:hypothetical protein V500_06828 [Pseudogymnoascus sp. VKM F-4518 (FW-2643)]